MNRKRDWACHDVEWFVPGRKRPAAWSTQSDSDLIRAMSDDGLTLDETHLRLEYAPDARRVVAVFVEVGLGPLTLSQVDELHRRSPERRRRGRR